MLKNERLVYAMTLEQRIKLITGIEFRNRQLDGYAFPVFELEAEPQLGRNARLTSFPSYAALACSFNTELIRKVYECIGNEIKASVKCAYSNVANEPYGAVTDPFITKCVAQAKINGLTESGAYVNFDNRIGENDGDGERADRRLITDALKESEPSSALNYNAADADELSRYNFKGLKFGVAAAKEDVARFLNSGYSFIYLQTDFTDELVPYLTELTAHYAKGADACKRGKITPEQLDACCNELKMLPAEVIDRACDRVISVLVGLTQADAASVAEPKTSLNGGEALFDEKYHSEIALEAARQSVVMLKNDGILPLAHELRVAVIGECAKSEAYNCDGNTPTQQGMPFNVINDYEIKTAGYAYGYAKGESRPDLIKTAVKLSAEADVTVMYLCAERGAKTLPPEQLEALNALSRSGAKIIAVAEADGELDVGFESECNAVLFIARGGQRAAAAEFEIISGLTNPSARLAFNMYNGGSAVYPIGYGLSYGKFEYSHLSVTEVGVSYTVTNTGADDGYSTAAMYVSAVEGESKLRGIGKAFVKKGDSAKVEIPFGAETFRSYDSSRGKFVNRGGEWTVAICDSAAGSVLNAEITLTEHVFDEVKESSTAEGTGNELLEDFAQTGKQSYEVTGRRIGYGGKIALAVLLALYACASAVLLIAGNIVSNLTGYIILGVAAVAVTIGAVIYCVRLTGKYNKLKNDTEPKYTGELVQKLAVFKELATVSYEQPVEPEQPEIEREDEGVEAAEEAAEQPKYETDFTSAAPENINYRANPTFNEICSNFREFALGYGADIEAASIRALFGAMAASKLVLLDIKNKEALPLFEQAFCEYMGGVTPVSAGWAWDKPQDLYWTLDGGKYVPSGFVNAIVSAVNTPDKSAAAVLDSFTPSQHKGCLADIIRYALFPSEEHTVKLNDETSVKLPRNICYVIITQNGFGEIPPEIAAASVQAELLISKAEPVPKPEIKYVSYTSYCELIAEAREKFYLAETYWKKIDDLVTVINNNERFSIGNKCVLQIEKLTSVILASGGDASEALIAAFTNKITAMLKTLNLYAQDNGEKALYNVIQKLFPDENTVKIQKALLKSAANGGRE